jgi:hypothetical protein
MDTRTKMVTIPEDKRQALIDKLVNNWGPMLRRQYFTLSPLKQPNYLLCWFCFAASVLGEYFYSKICTMAQILRSNAGHVWNRPGFTALIQEWDKYS